MLNNIFHSYASSETEVSVGESGGSTESAPIT